MDKMKDLEALEPHEAFLNGWLQLPSLGIPEHPPGKREIWNESGWFWVYDGMCHANVLLDGELLECQFDDGRLAILPYDGGFQCDIVAARRVKTNTTEPKAERDIQAEAGWFWICNGMCNEKHLFHGQMLEYKFEDGTFMTLPNIGEFPKGSVAARRVEPQAKQLEAQQNEALLDLVRKGNLPPPTKGVVMPPDERSEWNPTNGRWEKVSSTPSPRPEEAFTDGWIPLVQIGEYRKYPATPLIAKYETWEWKSSSGSVHIGLVSINENSYFTSEVVAVRLLSFVGNEILEDKPHKEIGITRPAVTNRNAAEQVMTLLNLPKPTLAQMRDKLIELGILDPRIKQPIAAMIPNVFTKTINGRDIQDIEAYERFRRSPRGRDALSMIGKHEGPGFKPMGEDEMNDIAAAALEAHDKVWPRRKK